MASLVLNNNAEGIDKEKNEMVMLKFNATFNRGVYQLTVNFAGTIGTEEKDGIYKTQMSNGEWLLLTKFKVLEFTLDSLNSAL
ncbi:hypothetical protein L596_027013 [Steinernema carpocapsae]|uniref:Uncharacterized protein n=1 Tax=Steinernema carpocapsae TaxID=34508 RepID=A0A4U5M323_STECR|nr:hypothetical protein L596_027013 [Steinernema carpocapsae]